MGTPLTLDNGCAVDLTRKPTPEEWLDLLHVGSRVPLDEVRRWPGGRIFTPAEVVRVQPGRAERAGARMDVAPPAVIAQLREIRAEPFGTGGGYLDERRFTHRLVSRRMMEVYNSTGDHLPALRRRWPYNPAFLHPSDLERMGAAPGDVVRIDSDHDFIYGVAEATHDVQPGVVSMAHARGDVPELDGALRRIGSNTGRLVSTARDFEPVSGMARQSAIPVTVRPLTDAERAALGVDG
jgi:anaerobic selenocysteine-containing dehydrogenase